MPVPGMWELNGYGDPLYVNIGYAWRGNFENNPPHVPDAENHVGSYRHTFEVPASWSGKDIFLSIGSATSNVYVWINGRFVGYSEDSKLAAEFDVTKFVKPGENLIALQMFRWSDGTYLEDQDFWRFSGIARGVTLTARDKAHLKDVRITPTLDADYRDAQLHVEVETTPRVKSVGLTLLDAAGEAVAEQQIMPAGGKAGCLFRVADPAKWSAEAPNVYTRSGSTCLTGGT
ncbi:MAG: sugar-binding domain-containing protein [Alistipes finegoldii]